MFFSKLLGKQQTPIQYRERLQRIGSYTIVREIGSGATSNVYLGLHVKTMRAAAVKQISLKFTSPSHKEMFATEASLCGKLDHPNVVSMYGADLDDPGGAYLVMEYVDGNSLDKFESPDKLLPTETLIDVMRQSAEALSYASTMGIIHRDVKPGNIILRKDGRAKIADFGCAFICDRSTTSLGVAGSLPYMSPEQLEGKPLSLQSDIYSLGAVFYRLLTGHYPFEVDGDEAPQTYARKILNTHPTPIMKYRQDVPKEITRVIDRALQKKPEDRYESWDVFLCELHRASVEKYAEDEELNIHWQSFEIRQLGQVVPHNYNMSFGI